jgi:hypothetical protein
MYASDSAESTRAATVPGGLPAGAGPRPPRRPAAALVGDDGIEPPTLSV